ncbi:MAG: Asp-tRNA(Asn)/Glu-tRNA(Gln) amidotransferase subunit GatC [Rickettsiales bacterium]|nr:Asp-tRNA(Asn)/Glu-tRNA(Gln) amidotransferase subunit GatC [Rickettsiales bacterium]
MKKFVDETKLKKLCKLAMLDVKKEEVERYLDLMNSSLETLEALDDINVDGLKELTNPYDMALIEYPDVVSDGDKVDQLMKCAPTSLYNYFVTPKVMEKK